MNSMEVAAFVVVWAEGAAGGFCYHNFCLWLLIKPSFHWFMIFYPVLSRRVVFACGCAGTIELFFG